MKKITSSKNPGLRAAIRLKTGRGRKTQGRIIVFGLREVQRAISAGIKALEIYLSSEVLSQAEIELLRKQTGPSTGFFDLPEKLLAELMYGERQDRVIAVARRPALELANLQLPDEALVVVLESIEKPGNIGAVLRSIDGSGASALVLANPQCDVFHPNSIRASMGSVFTIPAAVASTEETIAWCRSQNLTIFAASDAASISYTSASLKGNIAIAFGNEANGLSDSWLSDTSQDSGPNTIAIPMRGISDSLNISVAAGVILFEARRQRSRQGDNSQ